MHLRPLLAAAALIAVTFAGCLDGAAPPRDDTGLFQETDARGFAVPVPLCLPIPSETAAPNEAAAPDQAATLRCDFEMTPDEGRHGNEVSIAVNPTDPRNIVGGAKDYYPADAGECVWDGVYVTHGGARTAYEDRSFDGSPWRQLDDPDPSKANYATQFWCTTDPVLYFDVHGNLYYLLMAYQTDPVTGSKAGEEEIAPPCGFPCPHGALNDWAFNRATQIVAISDDGGDSFHTFTPVLEGSYPVNFHDKGWIAASPDGTIHVMWLAFFVPGNQYCRSTDDGQTYICTEIMAVQFQGSGQGSFLEVGTEGQVYALWTSGGAVQLRRSTDTGETWDAQRAIFEVNSEAQPGLSPRDRRGGFPMLATDRNTESPFADALYVVWQDDCNKPTWSLGCDTPGTGIYLAASHDEGTTWSTPVRLSDDREIYRIFPAVSVSPGGVVDVSWMEEGDAEYAQPEPHHGLEQAFVYSLDGGHNFSIPFQVRDPDDGGWDPALCKHQNGMIFIGDYNDIDSSWQAAHPVWPDSRHGICDVYTATLQRPMFAHGWDEAGRIAAEEWVAAHPL